MSNLETQQLTKTMLDRTCPICGSDDQTRMFVAANFDLAKLDEFAFASRKLPEYMHYRLLECPVCDLLYASPVLRQEDLAQAYHVAAFDSAEEAQFASRTYGKALSDIKRHLSDLTGALDVGTGDGAFLEQLITAGFSEVAGVEPSAAPLASAKPHIRPLIKHDIFRPQDFQPCSLSLITCFQTLEHLSNPLELCQQAAQILKPGGAVYFVCHNRRALSARLLKTKSPIFDIEHLQLFSPLSARYMLEKCGFENIKIKSVFNVYPLHYWLKLFPLPNRVKLPLIKFLKRLKIGYIPFGIPAGNLTVIGYRKNGA